jgi:DNA polymerase I-like protein with 3'-5' exonuclease and polymerase domains
VDSRDTAKTFIYAFLYGAGDAKIGQIVGGNKADGRALKARFLEKTPALRALRQRVSKAARRGYLVGLDGRRVEVRSAHAALNTLLQSAGAIIMKEFLVLLDHYCYTNGLDVRFVGNIHDEVQAEVAPKDVHTYTWIAQACMAKAGENFNLRVPLAADVNVGLNWSETH